MPTEIYYEDSSFETYFDCLTPACIVFVFQELNLVTSDLT